MGEGGRKITAKLYVSDLDGTLLQDDATLSPFARETLTPLLEDGLPFTVASARSGETMREVLGDLPLRLPIVEYNGAILSDYATGERLVVNDIETDAAQRMFDLLGREGHRPFVSTTDGTVDRLYYGDTTNDGAAWYLRDRISAGDSRLTPCSQPEDALGDRVVALTLIDSEERIRSLAASVEDGQLKGICALCFVAKYEIGWHWMTVQSDRATKDQAVRTLAERTGCDIADLTVFGDEINDEAMIKMAGRGIAVENGVPEVLAAADQVIGPNRSDSVPRFMAAEWAQR